MNTQIISATALIALLALAIGIGLGQHLFQKGTHQAQLQYEALLKDQLGLKQEMHDLAEKISVCENALQMDQLALEGSQQSLTVMQGELSSLLKEVGFYQRILSKDAQESGVLIEDLQVTEGDLSSFRIVLTQAIAKSKETQGRLQLSFSGQIDGYPEKLELEDVDTEQRSSLAFKFRYYKIISAKFLWPAGFIPEVIELSLFVKGKKEPVLEQTWAWGDLVTEQQNAEGVTELTN